MQTFSSSRKLGFDHGIDLLKLDPYQPPLSNAWLSSVCFTLSWLLPRELVTVTKYSQWRHKSNRRCAHMPFLLNAKFCKHFIWEMLARKWPIIGSKPQACPKAHFSAGLLDQPSLDSTATQIHALWGLARMKKSSQGPGLQIIKFSGDETNKKTSCKLVTKH